MTSLQITWFLLILVLIAGYSILDGFDLGTGIWHLFTKDENERQINFKAIGPYWDGNQVWLLTGGGAIFAAFSPVYATTFSGFYLAMVLVLMGLIFRAVSIEFRLKEEGKCWRGFWDKCFSIGSIVPALLFGVAVGNVLRGIPLDMGGNYTGSFFDLLNPYSLVFGVCGLLLFATHGALFLALKTPESYAMKARAWGLKSGILQVVVLIVVLLWTVVGGYIYGTLILPLSLGFLSLLALIYALLATKKAQDMKAFIASSLHILFFLSTGASALFPMMVPNSADLTRSLTVYNASSSQNTLTVMLIVALVGMPIVIGYTIYIYKAFAGRMIIKN